MVDSNFAEKIITVKFKEKDVDGSLISETTESFLVGDIRSLKVVSFPNEEDTMTIYLNNGSFIYCEPDETVLSSWQAHVDSINELKRKLNDGY